MTTREAIENQRRMAHALGGDPYGVRTITGARAAYARGAIDLDELERRVDLLLRGEQVPLTDAVL